MILYYDLLFYSILLVDLQSMDTLGENILLLSILIREKWNQSYLMSYKSNHRICWDRFLPTWFICKQDKPSIYLFKL